VYARKYTVLSKSKVKDPELAMDFVFDFRTEK
jgi:hypothetical protein